MKRILFVALVAIVLSGSTMAQKNTFQDINRQHLRSSMTFFASDELGGRQTGSICCEAAALFIKSNLMMLGVAPIPETGEYFQEVPMISYKADPEQTRLIIKDNRNRDLFTSDSILFLNPMLASGEITGKIVFAGYGYSDEQSGYNDFEGMDISGKIVMIMTNSPFTADQLPENVVINAQTELKKIWFMKQQNPKAIIYVYNPRNVYHCPYQSGICDLMPGGNAMQKIIPSGGGTSSDSIPTVFINQNTANRILKRAGYNLRRLEDRIIETSKPVSMEIPGIKASISSSVSIQEIESPNVIGIIEGSDPIMKEECIVYSAHFDHNGFFRDKEVFNGADDNASGSMALLELARAYMNLEQKPARTIVFAWFTGEEQGLLGSRYYTEHPVVPLENTLLNINLDMVGRSRTPDDTYTIFGQKTDVTNPGEVYVINTHDCRDLDNIVARSAKKVNMSIRDINPATRFGSTDYVSFEDKQLPFLSFTSGMHSDYHCVSDDVDRIDFVKLENITKMVFLIGYQVAERRDRIRPDKGLVMK